MPHDKLGEEVAAAVVLDPDRIPRGLNDSKKLSPEERERLYARICASAEVGVAFASPARIDRDNILRASLWALARSVRALPEAPKHVFVDGRQVVKDGEVLTIDRRALAGPLQEAQAAFVRNAPYVDFRGRSADEIAPLSFRVEGKN